MEQVDILISKTQVLQILYLKHCVYVTTRFKTWSTRFKTGLPDLKPIAQLTGFKMGQLPLTHFKTGQPILKY